MYFFYVINLYRLDQFSINILNFNSNTRYLHHLLLHYILEDLNYYKNHLLRPRFYTKRGIGTGDGLYTIVHRNNLYLFIISYRHLISLLFLSVCPLGPGTGVSGELRTVYKYKTCNTFKQTYCLNKNKVQFSSLVGYQEC